MSAITQFKDYLADGVHDATLISQRFLRNHLSPETREQILHITKVAKICLVILGYALTHILTIGLYTWYINNQKVKNLNTQVAELEKIRSKFKTCWSECEQQRTKAETRLLQELEDKEQALLTIEDLKSKFEANTQLLKISKDRCSYLEELQKNFTEKEQKILNSHQVQISNMTSTSSLGSLFKSIVKPEIKIQELSERIKKLVEENSSLTTQKASKEILLENAKIESCRLSAEIVELKLKLKQLNEQINRVDGEVRGIGPIPRKYQKQPDDPDEIDFNENLIAPYAYADNMPELIRKSFNHTFDKLLQEAKEENSNIHFNRSRRFIDYPANTQALYRMMVFNILLGAKLELDDCHSLHLLLNERGVAVSSSDPEKVLIKEYSFNPLDRDHPILVNKLKTRFKNHDDWTPKEEDRDLLNGIDPVSAKHTLHRLYRQKPLLIDYLHLLFLDPLILDSDPALIEAWRLSRENTPEGKLMTLSYEFICDIAFSISKNFSLVFSTGWEEKANSDEPVPIDKTTRSTSSTTQNEKLEEWKPLFLYIPSDIHEGLIKTMTLLSPIWENMSPELLKKPWISPPPFLPRTTCNYPQPLEEYYYWLHRVVDPHGCLFSAVATLLFQDESYITNDSIQCIKLSIANFLKVHPEKFTNEFKNATGFTVHQYIEWLNGNWRRDVYSCGDVELKLVSEVFGVRIEVLTPGQAIYSNPYKLISPEPLLGKPFTIGPNTNVVLTIYNSHNFSYYPIFQKMRAPTNKDSEELRAGLKHCQAFWKTKNRSNITIGN